MNYTERAVLLRVCKVKVTERVCTGFFWLLVGFRGRPFKTLWLTFGFHKCREFLDLVRNRQFLSKNSAARSCAFVQPLLLWKSIECYIFWVRVYSLGHPSCNSHVPYCHLWPARLYCVSPHYFIKGTIFEKASSTIKMCSDFRYNFGLKYISF